ncbi:YfhO family protein [Streptomyces sp. NPDC089919]|uniref:YfhO family protein n=1 Tax=Streptomyces sp. NPDC089919 TaxID=3155188 RepID=UPI003435A8D6
MTTSTTAAPTRLAPDRRGGTGGRSGPLDRIRSSGGAAAWSSALLSMAAYCLGMAAHGTYPFGQGTRAMNDLRNQYVPFHAYLWDIQHGTAQGDLLFNWQNGYGNGFLGEFFTYLANPFSWLTGLFPREYVDFPVFLVSLFSVGLAAAVMTVFLGRLRPGSPWLRALLGTGYATCGWSMIEGGIVPMWMWGLVALPLLCLAADYCLTERRWVLGTLFFALCWFANFYSAAMATIGAVLVLFLRLATAEGDWRYRGRVLGRATAMAVTGLLLAAPAVLVSGQASAQSQPSDSYVVGVGTAPLTYLGLLLPGSVPEPSAPNVFTGVLVLLLVLTLPFQSRVRIGERAGWLGLIVLTALSFVWTPTAKVWQGFTLPHGAPFRESFVLSGLLAMAAWICLAHMPRARALLGGTALLGTLVLLTRNTQPVNEYAIKGTLVGGAVIAALLLVYVRGLRRAGRTLVVGALATAVLGSTVYSVYAAHTLFDPAARGYTTVTQTMNGLAHRARAAAVAERDWPRSRTAVAPGLFVTSNDPMLLGVGGGGYYSSYVTKEAATGLRALGLGYALGGRSLHRTDDPFFNALMGVGTLLQQQPHGEVTARKAPAAPLLSLRSPGSDQAYGAPAGSVWAHRQAALGAQVYTVPKLAYTHGPLTGRGPDGWHLGPRVKDRAWSSFTAQCAPGDRAYLYAPGYFGMAVADGGQPFGTSAYPPSVLNPVKFLGTVPADGTLRFALGATRPGQVLPYDAVGCMNPGALDRAVAGLQEKAPEKISVTGHGIAAELPRGSRGTAVVAVPAIQGWSCSVNGGANRPPVSYQGLLGVPLGAGADRLSCSYTPPGLNAGLAGTGLGVLALGGVLLAPMVRRRRNVRRG